MKDETRDRSEFQWTKLFLLLALLILLAVVVVPNFRHARTTSPPPICLGNLVQIDAAKEQWALDNKKTNGTPLTSADIADILGYMKGSAMPVCPAGGVYSFGKIGKDPTCSLAAALGHTIRADQPEIQGNVDWTVLFPALAALSLVAVVLVRIFAYVRTSGAPPR